MRSHVCSFAWLSFCSTVWGCPFGTAEGATAGEMVAGWPLGVEGMCGTICGCPGAGDGSCMRTSRRTDIVAGEGQGGGCGKREAGVERWAVFKDQAQPPAPLARSWRSARSTDSACLCVAILRLFPPSNRDLLLFFSRAPSFSGAISNRISLQSLFDASSY